MKRRDFIKTSILTSSALVIGCGDKQSAKLALPDYADRTFVVPLLAKPEIIDGKKIFKF